MCTKMFTVALLVIPKQLETNLWPTINYYIDITRHGHEKNCHDIHLVGGNVSHKVVCSQL